MIRNLAVYQVFASVAWDLRWAIMGSWSDYSYSSLLVNTKLAHVGISTAAWGGSIALCCLFCVQWGVCLRTFLFSPALGLYGSIVQCSVSNGHPIPYWQIVRSHSKLVSTVCSVPCLIFDRIMTDPNIHTQIRRAVILLLWLPALGGWIKSSFPSKPLAMCSLNGHTLRD